MHFIGHFIVRMIAILFGLFFAMLAASIFISIGLFGGFFEQLFSDLDLAAGNDGRDSFSLVAFAILIVSFFSSFHIASIAALPVGIAIAIAELMRWQGMTINLVLGGVVALFAGTSLYAVDSSGMPSEGTLVVLLATGFVAGFFYWLIAGRSAGKWLDTKSKQTTGDNSNRT